MMHYKRLITVLMLFFYSFLYAESSLDITFQMIEEKAIKISLDSLDEKAICETFKELIGRRISIKGFLVREDQRYFLSFSPVLKSCCMTPLQQAFLQIALTGDFADFPLSTLVQAEGYLRIDKSEETQVKTPHIFILDPCHLFAIKGEHRISLLTFFGLLCVMGWIVFSFWKRKRSTS